MKISGLPFLISTCLVILLQSKIIIGQVPKQSIGFGFNVTRVFAGDAELQTDIKLSSFHLILAGGYDFNTIGKYFTESTSLNSTEMCSSVEEESNGSGRYWLGEGAAIRIAVERDFHVGEKHPDFISIEYLFKNRDYTNKSFCDGGIKYSESAEQQISGLTLYYGKRYYLSNTINLKLHVGIGYRNLISNVITPAWYSGSYYNPESSFQYRHTYPSFHLGLSV